jgi:hypothetical protein
MTEDQTKNEAASKQVFNKPKSPFAADPHNHRGQKSGKKSGGFDKSSSVKKKLSVAPIRTNRGGDR